MTGQHKKSTRIAGVPRERTFRIPLGGAKTRKFKFPRLMSKGYCKKTPCKKMGFTQRSSCRPYKNCFTRKNTSGGTRRRR